MLRMSNDNNMDMMFVGNSSNSIERKLEVVLNHSLGQCDIEANRFYEIPSQHLETRNIARRIETTKSDRPMESMEMLSGELNLRLS